ncbi:MAG: NifB/NifX family molybdenum-iron cluster-binding protein [Candidatus Omnitrophica bacterium]|nr:NifB/NifX family molybdenum-iron cluster-binding protein [Candidatus Omnitrophota bacterium]
MKICVTSQGDNLNSRVDPRFGRCKYFIIVDTDNLQFEAIRNPSIDAASGAGIQSGQLMASKQVKVVLSGNIGPNAHETLTQAGIEVITGVTGSIKEAIEDYKAGKLKAKDGPSVNSKFGISGK